MTPSGPPPPCPAYSERELAELARLVEDPNYDGLEYYLGRLEVYCDAIEELR